MEEMERELAGFFSEQVNYLHKDWIERGEEALADIVKKDIQERKPPADALRWTNADLQWDELIMWLQRSVEEQKSNLPYYVLLWLATDKVHGFWRRKREKSLDNPAQWERFSWSLRSRIGAASTVLSQIGEPSTLHRDIIWLFRNPLLFRLNPKGKLLSNDGIRYWEEQDGEWRRALDVLSYPLTMKQILMVKETMLAVDRRLSNQKTLGTTEERWLELTEGQSLEAMVMTVDKTELFSLLPKLVQEKESNKYDSPEELVSLCSYLVDFWRKMTEFEVVNQYFTALIVHDEQGFGKDIRFY